MVGFYTVNRTPKSEMLDLLTKSIERQGAQVEVTKGTHPFNLSIKYKTGIFPYKVYIYNLTPHTPHSDHYRIQITGNFKSLRSTPTRPALLLGWEPRKKVFVGYRSEAYKSFGASPSIHASLPKMQEAKRKGISIQTKRPVGGAPGQEIVVAMRPDRVLDYIMNRETYHTPLFATANQSSQSGVQITDNTVGSSKQKAIERALKVLRRNRGNVVTSRPPIDLTGLFHRTSGFAGRITGTDHVSLEYSTKIGRGGTMNPQPNSNCTGGIVYVESGYESVIPSGTDLGTFDRRIKRILYAMREGSEGPNPENIRTMVTNASTDAKLFRQHDFIGFNALDALDTDAFWVMAAGREVAYLKYVERYQHLRAMTELAVRAFTNLGLLPN